MQPGTRDVVVIFYVPRVPLKEMKVFRSSYEALCTRKSPAAFGHHWLLALIPDECTSVLELLILVTAGLAFAGI
jgi:hypothetical protein